MLKTDSRIKILFVHPAFNVGGAERLRIITLGHLKDRRKYDIKVCSIESPSPFADKVREIGIEVISLNCSSKPYNISATGALFKYLIKNKFDIVQTSLFNANFHGRIAAYMARVPVIISEEHSEHYQYNSAKFLPYIWADRILSGITDRIICCSDNLAKSISEVEGIAKEKLFTLVNTFDASGLQPMMFQDDLKREIGIGPEDVVIGNIASLSPRKGQDLLIRAFCRVKKEFKSLKLVLIGEESPDYKKRLLAIASDFGLIDDIIFLGKKDDVASFFRIMDIFVLSSLHEGIPLALLEAMYMELPVVAPSIGGVPEVITHRKNGFLFASQDEKALADSVIELLKDTQTRRDIAKAGKKTVCDKFSEERYIDGIEALYTKLFKGNGHKNSI